MTPAIDDKKTNAISISIFLKVKRYLQLLQVF